MAANRSISKLARTLLVLSIPAAMPSGVSAAGLNTDVALTPPEGGWIVRAQWRYTRQGDDPTGLGRKVDLSLQPLTAVYGVTADLALQATVPIAYRKIVFGSGAEQSDTGVGDIPLLAKYRFYQKDKPGVTTRWAAVGGLEIPTFDDAFSSKSFDLIIGTVWTHQERDWWIDWDILYKFNTAGGLDGDDELRGDVAASLRLFGGEGDTVGPWGLYAIAELNALYLTDGSVQVFGSPGIQLITPNVILEAGVQLPMHQDLAAPRLENDFTVVLSVRIQF